ncbi:MAG TPA: divalent-cation tolerance protein CutA [Candidatus Polarisedimenticolaceae bacterium]|nr:divalent-cation tolerance protein CutA [Candidatus Polarisedimenticolaceae bacterium]
MAERCVLVLTTAGSADQADGLAQALVERRLAACVNVVAGVRSTYRWRGVIEREAELLLVIKTVERLFEPVRAAIRELHGYELPEVVCVPLAAGDPDYLRWLEESVRAPSPD